MGRGKVQFNWAGASAKSDWMRMIQPHSGGGKGFYFIPEIGEEILVGFEGNNAQNPYVLGSQYNGSKSSGYADGENNVKAIHTRSGTKIIMKDSEGSILIEDPSGNTWQMDGQGNISVNAPNDITMNAGGSISMTAGKNINSSATMNISESAGVNHSVVAGAIMIQNAGGDYRLMAANIFEEAKGERKSKAKEVSDESKDKKVTSKNKNEIHTKGDFENNGGESTRMH
ncbi:phage baseplate assembly protein V [Flavobacterium sp. PL002]|uniref:phage baseplate assembly protein V n=1 Tax=Flavobacterium sp. PL002 TaxID=1897058 RepID=UPI00178821FD|nr:Actin cross-linking toxin VgrG1 [Flavobacterium sp. PL002]